MSTLIVEVCKINRISPHDNADRLEIATVGGWQCIVLKDRFKKGDKIVYIPIDSMIPFELSEKLGITKYLENPEKDENDNILFSRVRTVKLRGIISQGLVIDADPSWELGKDVKDILGIKKYIPRFKNHGGPNLKHKTPKWRLPEYPDFNKYTNIENINHYIDVFEEGEEVVVLEKIHGTNSRFGKINIDIDFFPFFERLTIRIKKIADKLTFGIYSYDPFRFLVGSHNCNIKKPKREQNYKNIINVYWKIAKKYDLENKLHNDEEMFAEIYGINIQKYFEYDATEDDPIKARFFDLKFRSIGMKEGEYELYKKDLSKFPGHMVYANWDVFTFRCEQLNLPIVPVLYRGPFHPDLINEYKTGKSMIGNHMREGCVIKPVFERFHPKLGRVILKCISEEYLLFKAGKEDEMTKNGEESPELDIYDH